LIWNVQNTFGLLNGDQFLAGGFLLVPIKLGPMLEANQFAFYTKCASVNLHQWSRNEICLGC